MKIIDRLLDFLLKVRVPRVMKQAGCLLFALYGACIPISGVIFVLLVDKHPVIGWTLLAFVLFMCLRFVTDDVPNQK